MPVQKFCSIEEMNKAPVPESRGSDFERFLRLCAQWWAIAPKYYPRGVFKFRTIEEAQKAREKYLPLKRHDGPRSHRGSLNGIEQSIGTPEIDHAFINDW